MALSQPKPVQPEQAADGDTAPLLGHEAPQDPADPRTRLKPVSVQPPGRMGSLMARLVGAAGRACMLLACKLIVWQQHDRCSAGLLRRQGDALSDRVPAL